MASNSSSTQIGTARQDLSFGLVLQRHRRARGLTQEELAERARLSAQAISALERGFRTQPRAYTVEQLADALGLEGFQREEFAASAGGARQHSSGPLSRSRPTGNFLGAVPFGSLIGRQTELQHIANIIETVCGGAGRLVLLAGEPGVGKTRLAQEVTLTLQELRFLVATGSCHESQQAVPYGPFLDILSTVSEAAPPDIRSVMEQRWPYLGSLLPEQFRVAPRASATGKDEQPRLMRAVANFLIASSEEVPIGLLLDDLHWADAASLALLQHLARSTRGHRIFLLGTCRTTEVHRQDVLERALLDLGRAGVVEQLKLCPLSVESTAALAKETVEEELSQEVAQLIYARTEGNPFFVKHLLRALMERGDELGGAGRWTGQAVKELAVPESVRGVIRQRLARLSSFTQTILRQASVLGQTFAFDDLLEMGRHGEEHLEEALMEASATGLVQEIDVDRYAFDHAITQRALYEELPTRRKRSLHRAAGEALERESGLQTPADKLGRAAGVAWHFREAGETARALPHAIQAGEQAQAVFAHEEAEEHYRSALQLARNVGDQAAEARVLERLGSVLETRARYSEARQVLDRAARLLQALGDGEGECRVVARLGSVHLGKGTPEEGLEILESLLERVQTGSFSPGLTAVYASLARLYVTTAQLPRGLAAAERAVELAHLVGDDRTAVEATSTHGLTLLYSGRTDQALPALEEACRLAERGGDLPTICRTRRAAADACRDLAKFEKSGHYAEGALEIALRIGEPTMVIELIGERGRIAMYTGNWSTARTDFEHCVEMSHKIGAQALVVHALGLLGEFLVRAGEWEEARAALEEARALGERAGYQVSVQWAQHHLANLDLLEGCPASARLRLLPLLDRLSEQDSGASTILASLARVHLELEEAATACELAGQAVAAARLGPYPLGLAESLLAQAVILVRRRQAEAAKQVLEETIGLARAMPYPYVEASALYECGLMHIDEGEPEQGHERLEKALVIFRRLGARKDVERTVKALHDVA
jgi:predicted ATPase/DNA-binding XRE family transcriptional regulator